MLNYSDDIETGKNRKVRRKRDEERQEQETAEQGISLLYTPYIFKISINKFRGSL